MGFNMELISKHVRLYGETALLYAVDKKKTVGSYFWETICYAGSGCSL